MAFLRCPQCHNIIEASAQGAPVCPRCGFSGPAPPAATTPYGSTSPRAPGPAPAYQPAQAAPPQTYGAPPHAAPPTSAWGRPRNFWVSFLLGIVTLGVYYWVWNYKVFRELDREHGVPHASAWFWSALCVMIGAVVLLVVASVMAAADTPRGQEPDTTFALLLFYPLYLVGVALLLAYMYKEIARLERFRQMRGLPEGLAPVWFLLLYIFGMFILVPTIVAYFLVQKSVNEVWWNVYTQRQIPWPL